MTLSARLDRLELLCALLRAIYDSRTERELNAAMERMREAVETYETLG